MAAAKGVEKLAAGRVVRDVLAVLGVEGECKELENRAATEDTAERFVRSNRSVKSLKLRLQ